MTTTGRLLFEAKLVHSKISEMSFFNVTQLGLQNQIKSAVKVPSSNDNPDRVTLSEPVYPNSESNGSHVKYTERLHKHIRPKQGKLHCLFSLLKPNVSLSICILFSRKYLLLFENIHFKVLEDWRCADVYSTLYKPFVIMIKFYSLCVLIII